MCLGTRVQGGQTEAKGRHGDVMHCRILHFRFFKTFSSILTFELGSAHNAGNPNDATAVGAGKPIRISGLGRRLVGDIETAKSSGSLRFGRAGGSATNPEAVEIINLTEGVRQGNR